LALFFYQLSKEIITRSREGKDHKFYNMPRDGGDHHRDEIFEQLVTSGG
jgi:hypothetical protein